MFVIYVVTWPLPYITPSCCCKNVKGILAISKLSFKDLSFWCMTIGKFSCMCASLWLSWPQSSEKNCLKFIARPVSETLLYGFPSSFALVPVLKWLWAVVTRTQAKHCQPLPYITPSCCKNVKEFFAIRKLSFKDLSFWCMTTGKFSVNFKLFFSELCGQLSHKLVHKQLNFPIVIHQKDKPLKDNLLIAKNSFTFLQQQLGVIYGKGQVATLQTFDLKLYTATVQNKLHYTGLLELFLFKPGH